MQSYPSKMSAADHHQQQQQQQPSPTSNQSGQPNSGYGQVPPVYGMEPPPPYSMQPPPPIPGFTTFAPGGPGPQVIAIQPVSIGLSPNPVQITCPKCNATTLTETRVTPGLLTYLASGALFLCGCWFGCCLIPCCIPDCMDVEHRCSNCKINIGTYRRL